MLFRTNIFRDQGNKHDFIGTAFLPISAISGPGDLGEGKLRNNCSNACLACVHLLPPLREGSCKQALFIFYLTSEDSLLSRRKVINIHNATCSVFEAEIRLLIKTCTHFTTNFVR